MDARSKHTATRELHSQAFRSASQHTLSGDHKATARSARKIPSHLAAKDEKRRSDRYRSLSKEKQASIDPRFRRERTRSPKKANQSKSDSTFAPNQEKTNTHSTPAIAKAAVFNEKTLHPPIKQQTTDEPLESNKEVHQTVENSVYEVPVTEVQEDPVIKLQVPEVEMEQRGEETNDENDDGDDLASLENHVNSIMKSLLSNEEEDEEISSKKSPDKEDSLVSTKSSVGSYQRRRNNSWGGNQTNNPHNHSLCRDPRIMKRYAYLMANNPKRNNSLQNLINMPQMKRPKSLRDRCNCAKCTPVTINEDVLKEHFKMPVLFLTGSGIAVVLMAFVAWILSNDFIWNLVNSSTIRQVERRNPLVTTFFSYISGALLFTINLIFGTIYNLFVLPRNAVFKSAEEPWTPWQYINLK